MDWWEILLGVLFVGGGIAALIGELWLYDWALSREPKAERRNWKPRR